MEKITIYKLYNPSAKLKRQFGLDQWKKVKGEDGVYAFRLNEKNRCSNDIYAPCFVFNTNNKILEVYYPHFSTGAEIDIRHTRREVERGLKELLKPHKYLAVVTRDNTWKRNGLIKYNYTIDYYAEVDRPPTDEEISAICEICENPILE